MEPQPLALALVLVLLLALALVLVVGVARQNLQSKLLWACPWAKLVVLVLLVVPVLQVLLLLLVLLVVVLVVGVLVLVVALMFPLYRPQPRNRRRPARLHQQEPRNLPLWPAAAAVPMPLPVPAKGASRSDHRRFNSQRCSSSHGDDFCERGVRLTCGGWA